MNKCIVQKDTIRVATTTHCPGKEAENVNPSLCKNIYHAEYAEAMMRIVATSFYTILFLKKSSSPQKKREGEEK
jgi:hypothetical protein